MGLASVRAAVVATFSEPPIDTLDAVYTTDPIVERPNDPWPAGHDTVAWASVHLARGEELRRSFPAGMGGFKHVAHKVTLSFELQNLTSRDDAVAAHDSLIDSVVARLRANNTLGGAPGIFSAGEGVMGDNDANVEYTVEEPWTETNSGGQVTTMYSTLSFTVVEMAQV